MIYFVTALYYEAAPFIEFYKMKKQLYQNNKFDIFKSNEAVLIISGNGYVMGAAATSCILTIYPAGKNDLFVNIGTCIGDSSLFSLGDITICNKLFDGITEKYYYPFFLKEHPFIEAALSSYGKRVNIASMPASDTDGAPIYQAACKFVDSEQIILIKIVTGFYRTETLPGKNSIAQIIKNKSARIIEWLNNYVSGNLKNLPMFSHVYVEKGAEKYDVTNRTLSKLKNSEIISINHYKDVFSPKNQNFSIRKKSRKLIIAVKQSGFLYRGSNLCQDFGNENFYYTSDMLNCIYDCSYCYLQGMYPSADIVLFANIDMAISEAEKLLANINTGNPLYICISYNSDMLALEGLTGFVKRWAAFARENKNALIEARTKSVNFEQIADYMPISNFILAWTISPDIVSEKFENLSPSMEMRIKCVNKALDAGCRVRLCFDPAICMEGYEQHYESFFDSIVKNIDVNKLDSVSIGAFRVPVNYFKKMKKLNLGNDIYNYAYNVENGYVCGNIQKILDIFRQKGFAPQQDGL